MDRFNLRHRLVYAEAILEIDEARERGDSPPRWAVLITREWSEMPEPVDVE